jgi:hypothetical protein
VSGIEETARKLGIVCHSLHLSRKDREVSNLAHLVHRLSSGWSL